MGKHGDSSNPRLGLFWGRRDGEMTPWALYQLGNLQIEELGEEITLQSGCQ